MTSLHHGTVLQEDASESSKGFGESHSINPFIYWSKVGLRVSPDSKGGEKDFTSLWEEQHILQAVILQGVRVKHAKDY